MSQPETRRPPLPERISGLAAVATNLSWSWSRDARALFRMLDGALWHLTRHNPIELLRRVDPAVGGLCAGPRLPGALRRAHRVERMGRRHARYLVRDDLSGPRAADNRLLLCRVRAARLGADLLGGPRRSRGRPL